MLRSVIIEAEIQAARARLDALQEQLHAARLEECRIPFKIGDRVTYRGVTYEVGSITPWATDSAWLRGYKIKKDGTPGSQLVSIGSAEELANAAGLLSPQIR